MLGTTNFTKKVNPYFKELSDCWCSAFVLSQEKVKGADGVIVGSAFIDVLLAQELNYSQKIKECSELAKIIKSEINS